MDTKRLEQLVYVMYNKKLKDRHLKHKALKEDDDPLILENVSSDDDWVVGLESENAHPSPTSLSDDDDLDVPRSTPRQKSKEHSKSKSSGPSGEFLLSLLLNKILLFMHIY